jgi:hypothetical protein
MWDPEPDVPPAPPPFHARGERDGSGHGHGYGYALTGAEFERRVEAWSSREALEDFDASVVSTAGYTAMKEKLRMRELYAAAVLVVATLPVTGGMLPGISRFLGLGPSPSPGTMPDARGPVARMLVGSAPSYLSCRYLSLLCTRNVASNVG